MAIVEATISAAVSALADSLNTADPTQKDPLTTQKEWADGLATIIANAIKTATVTIPPGSIITVGSPSTQTQSVPAIVLNALT